MPLQTPHPRSRPVVVPATPAPPIQREVPEAPVFSALSARSQPDEVWAFIVAQNRAWREGAAEAQVLDDASFAAIRRWEKTLIWTPEARVWWAGVCARRHESVASRWRTLVVVAAVLGWPAAAVGYWALIALLVRLLVGSG